MNTTVTPAYMPVLRTKEAEKQALNGLEMSDKMEMLPLFDVQAPDPGDSVDRVLQEAIAFFSEVWPAKQEFLLDISQLGSELRTTGGKHPLLFLAEGCTEASMKPTICFAFDRSDSAYEDAFMAAMQGQGADARAAFRLQQHDLLFWNETVARIAALQSRASLQPAQLTIIADLQSLRTSQTVDTVVLSSRLVDLAARGFGRLVALASNMPESQNLPKDEEIEIRRLEVDIWEALLKTVPTLIFGDYGIVHPTSVYIPHSGMAIPAPKAKYTMPTRWHIFKGHKPAKGEASQYRQIARKLVKAAWFRANDFGWGDEAIRAVAAGRLGKTGGNTSWIAYTTQIHLAMTVRQVAVAVRAVGQSVDANQPGQEH
jgi:hypothetical protein